MTLPVTLLASLSARGTAGTNPFRTQSACGVLYLLDLANACSEAAPGRDGAALNRAAATPEAVDPSSAGGFVELGGNEMSRSGIFLGAGITR